MGEKDGGGDRPVYSNTAFEGQYCIVPLRKKSCLLESKLMEQRG